MRTLIQSIRNISNREDGQTLTEYGLLLFLIAIFAILAITFLGEEISTIFSSVATSLSGA